jgi:apolipoprotein N-acyltransferase
LAEQQMTNALHCICNNCPPLRHMMTKQIAVLEQHPGIALLAAGGLSATGFQPLGLWPVTLFTFALLIHLMAKCKSGRKAFLLGWLFGFAQLSVGLFWMAHAFTYQDAMPHWLGWFASPLLSLYLAIYPGIAAWLAWRFGRRDMAMIVILLAATWIVTEWLRGTMLTGFPWNPLIAAFTDVSVITQVIGTYGAGGIVILASGALLHCMYRKWHNALKLFILPLLALLAVIPGYIIGQQNEMTLLLHVVQPNIGQKDKYRPGYEGQNFAKLAAMTKAGAKNRARLILWPEAAVPYQLTEEADKRALIASVMEPGDILLTGADTIFKTRKQRGNMIETEWIGAANSAYALDHKGRILWRYDKAHLVPFGEYLPMRQWLEPLGLTRLVPGDLDFWPGPGPRSHYVPELGKIGTQICYEIIFSGALVDRDDRPLFIFNPSNDAWYGSWNQPQFLAQARLRAIEEGLPIIRSTPTGISAVIDANGHVVAQIAPNKPGFVQAELPMANPPTLFARFGNILPLGFAVLLMGFAFLPLAQRQTSR